MHQLYQKLIKLNINTKLQLNYPFRVLRSVYLRVYDVISDVMQ